MYLIKNYRRFCILIASLIGFGVISRPIIPAHDPARPPVQKGATADAEAKDPVILTVGDRQIRASELERRIEGLPPQHKTYYQGEGKRQFVNELLRIEMLNGEAIRRKLDQLPAVKTQLEMARSSILANAAMQAIEKEIPVSEVEAQAFFLAHTKEFEEIQVRHILVRSTNSLPPPEPGSQWPTPDEARAKAETLRKKIISGADFAQTAKEQSDDKATAAQGGNVGYIKRGMNIPPFEAAAFALNPGQISEVVETAFGFHIIKMDSKKTFAELKDQIVVRVQQTKAKEKLTDMVKGLNPIINEGYFKGAHPGHQSEPIPSFDLEVRPKSKSSGK